MNNRFMKLSTAVSSITLLAAVFVTPVSAAGPQSSGPTYLYKTTFVRAAPGKLLDLIALYKGRMAVEDASGDAPPFWWRHTQGDQWDLMLLYPVGSYTEYYSKARLARREKAASASGLSVKEFAQKLNASISWREDVFVMGPPLETMKNAFEGAAYFHVEIFISLPGKQGELYKEREMENAYQKGTGRPETMIFVRDQGAVWDIFSLGCYRDLKDWASSGDVSKETKEAAARQAGFADPDAIGPYLRTLIDMHRDTMGVAIK
ncbi:MAG: hypothetical protein ABSG19_09750 [Candidatus Aminicenantales bacterium]